MTIFKIVTTAVFLSVGNMSHSFLSSASTHQQCNHLKAAVTDLFEDSLEEVVVPRQLDSIGKTPKWLKGTLLRNGPALFGVPQDNDDDKIVRRFDHVFDGLAKITRYHFNDDNTIEFSARFLDTFMYKVIILMKCTLLLMRCLKLTCSIFI